MNKEQLDALYQAAFSNAQEQRNVEWSHTVLELISALLEAQQVNDLAMQSFAAVTKERDEGNHITQAVMEYFTNDQTGWHKHSAETLITTLLDCAYFEKLREQLDNATARADRLEAAGDEVLAIEPLETKPYTKSDDLDQEEANRANWQRNIAIHGARNRGVWKAQKIIKAALAGTEGE